MLLCYDQAQEVDMNHIRVFRRIAHGQGRPQYEIRSFSNREVGVHETIVDAARTAKMILMAHGRGVDISIEFRPEHDIEWPRGERVAYRCESLTSRERHEFYEAFVKEEE
jgi:hypothetical protein